MKHLTCLIIGLAGFFLSGGNKTFGQENVSHFNVLNYGAKPDKNFNAQKAIQKAIDVCSDSGGGTVEIPAGTFYSSTVYLKNNVNLHLSAGATWVAIPDSALYENIKKGLQNAGDNFISALIVAKNVSRISISGKGIIKGMPEFYYTRVTQPDVYPGWTKNAMQYGVDMTRPWVKNPKLSLIYITNSEDIKITGVELKDSPNWSCHLQWSKNIQINGIKISSSLEHGVNSDGLDIDGCRNVIVSDCIIRTGDDAICLKTTQQNGRTEKCEDIVVQNCILSSSSCAFKIGTETYSDFNRIIFSNSTIQNTNRAIGIIVRDGAQVNEVTCSNILLDCKRKPFFWWGNGEAFHFNVINRNKTSKTGGIHHVTLKNISGKAEGYALIQGISQAEPPTISDIRLENINLDMYPESEKDKRTREAVLIKDAAHITIRGLSVKFHGQQDLWKNGLVLDHVSRLKVAELSIEQPSGREEDKSILLNNCRDAFINLDDTTVPLINSTKVEGGATQNIYIKTLKNTKPSLFISKGIKNQVEIF